MKKVTIFALVMILVGGLLYGIPTDAEESVSIEYEGESQKEEVVYAKLDYEGSAGDVYVVNIFEVDAPEEIVEFGDYSKVENLTNEDAISLNGDKVTIDAQTDDLLYYQGDMKNTELPWEFQIEYRLDGKDMKAEDLIGQSGEFEMSITSTQNENYDATFYDYYMLQITVPLDAQKFTEISPDEGTVANVGSIKQITYSVLPGQDADINLKAIAKDFSLDSMQIAAVPFSMAIELPEEVGKIASLSDAIAQLNEGAAQLSAAMTELANGADSLADGSQQFADGLEQMDSLSVNFTSASKQILDALNTIRESLPGDLSDEDLTSIKDLPDILYSLMEAVLQTSDGASSLNVGFSNAHAELENAIAGISSEPLNNAELGELYANNPGNATLETLVNSYGAAAKVKGVYANVSPAFDAIEINLPLIQDSTKTVSDTLKLIADQIEAAFAGSSTIEMLDQLTLGLNELSKNYTEFDKGMNTYFNGVSELAVAYSALNSGTGELAYGANEVSKGVMQLHNGTEILAVSTKDLPAKVDEMLSGYDTTGFIPVSFASAKNGEIAAVQFIMQTGSITAVEEDVDDEDEEEESSLLDRIVNLFK